jgi:hypothetical protein
MHGSSTRVDNDLVAGSVAESGAVQRNQQRNVVKDVPGFAAGE